MEFPWPAHLHVKPLNITIMKTLIQISFAAFLLSGFQAATQVKALQPTCGISGQVLERQSREAIPYATVTLLRNDSVLIGTTADASGHYCIAWSRPGKYKLRAAYVGYKTITVPLVYDGKTKRTDLLIAAAADKSLHEVVTKKDFRAMVYEEPMRVMATPLAAGSYNSTADVYNTEEYSYISDNGYKTVGQEPLSTFSIDVDKASYSNTRRFLSQGTLPPTDAVRVEEFVNYFSYHYPQPANGDPFAVSTSYFTCPWNPGHQLVHIGVQGKEIATERLPATNLVFLIDVSGSMESADKLPLLKSGLRLLVDQLRPTDKVSIVVYAGAAGVVLQPTPGNRKDEIIAALDRLQACGSTAGGQGIRLAYATARENFMKEGNNRVILATDGDFNVGASSEGELVRLIEGERADGIYLTVLGFGTGNYKDSKMEQLADKGNGNYAYIDNLLEAKKTLVKEMGGTLLTIAKDVKIQVEFNPAKVKAYRLVGYENRLLNKEDFNDDKKDAGELGSGHTVTAIYEIVPAGSDEVLPTVDSLKYQANPGRVTGHNNELMTIKLRYKRPSEETSRLITTVVADRRQSFDNAGDDVRFAAAVASFGMLLRDSQYKGNSSFREVLAWARAAKGKDEEGYRAEFIRLVEMAELLKKS